MSRISFLHLARESQVPESPETTELVSSPEVQEADNAGTGDGVAEDSLVVQSQVSTDGEDPVVLEEAISPVLLAQEARHAQHDYERMRKLSSIAASLSAENFQPELSELFSMAAGRPGVFPAKESFTPETKSTMLRYSQMHLAAVAKEAKAVLLAKRKAAHEGLLSSVKGMFSNKKQQAKVQTLETLLSSFNVSAAEDKLKSLVDKHVGASPGPWPEAGVRLMEVEPAKPISFKLRADTSPIYPLFADEAEMQDLSAASLTNFMKEFLKVRKEAEGIFGKIQSTFNKTSKDEGWLTSGGPYPKRTFKYGGYEYSLDEFGKLHEESTPDADNDAEAEITILKPTEIAGFVANLQKLYEQGKQGQKNDWGWWTSYIEENDSEGLYENQYDYAYDYYMAFDVHVFSLFTSAFKVGLELARDSILLYNALLKDEK